MVLSEQAPKAEETPTEDLPAGATPAPAESAAPQKAWGLLAGVSKL